MIVDCRSRNLDQPPYIYMYTHVYGRYIHYHYHSPSIAAYITSNLLARKSPRAPTCRRRRAARPRKCSGFWPAMLGMKMRENAGKMGGKNMENH